MTYEQPFRADPWPTLLARLDGPRRRAVDRALRKSAEQGWPASDQAARLLVAYALGEIDAWEYAAEILITLGFFPRRTAAVPAASWSPRVRREDAVQAYMTGRIAVGEFLRISRGVSA